MYNDKVRIFSEFQEIWINLSWPIKRKNAKICDKNQGKLTLP
jgi:hypothetical protein